MCSSRFLSLKKDSNLIKIFLIYFPKSTFCNKFSHLTIIYILR